MRQGASFLFFLYIFLTTIIKFKRKRSIGSLAACLAAAAASNFSRLAFATAITFAAAAFSAAAFLSFFASSNAFAFFVFGESDESEDDLLDLLEEEEEL